MVEANGRRGKADTVAATALPVAVREVCFLVYPGFDILDLTGPLEVFEWAERQAPGSYRVSVMSIEGGSTQSSGGLSIFSEQAVCRPFDTLIVIGGDVAAGRATPNLIDYVRRAAQEARRVASVCTGAFLLADAGLLDGRAVTTHWRVAAQLQEAHPSLRVLGDRIFLKGDPVWSSAGISAGIDMALALIEEDLGRQVAQSVARILVVYLRRHGGQLQFSSLLELGPGSDRIQRVLTYAREHLIEPLPVARLAEIANLSGRQFSRAFVAATGMTPAKAIDRLRVEAARPRVEFSREPLDEISRSTGFSDPSRMRQSFLRVLGQTPQTLRRLAREDEAYRAKPSPRSTSTTCCPPREGQP